MAKYHAEQSAFTPIPEGRAILKIVEIDSSKYEDFGKVSFKLQNKKGQTMFNSFTLKNDDGEIKESIYNAFAYFCRTALLNSTIEDWEDDDLLNRFIGCEIEHQESINEETGEAKTYARIKSKSLFQAKEFEDMKDTSNDEDETNELEEDEELDLDLELDE